MSQANYVFDFDIEICKVTLDFKIEGKYRVYFQKTHLFHSHFKKCVHIQNVLQIHF